MFGIDRVCGFGSIVAFKTHAQAYLLWASHAANDNTVRAVKDHLDFTLHVLEAALFDSTVSD